MAFPRLMSLSSAFATLSLTASLVSAYAQQPIKGRQVPQLVHSAQTRVLGTFNRNEELTFVINLALRNEDELDTLLTQLSDPTSPNFRRYLTPGEFDSRFGPTQESFNEVLSWAESNGFTVVSKAPNGRYVEARGSVAAINKAFHISLTSYRDGRSERNFFAPDREPTVDLSVPLASIEGLETSEPLHNNLVAGPNATRTIGRDTQPVSQVRSATGSNTSGAHNNLVNAINIPDSIAVKTPRVTGSAPGGYYLPSDMRAAYYGSGPLTGAGQSVDIFSFDGYLTSDLNLYYAQSGFTSTVPVTNRLVGTYSGGCFSSSNGTSGTCDDGEQILDIVQVQGMAPGLDNIYFYEGTSASPELALMAADNNAKVISSSWGGGGFGTASDTYFKQFAAQGQSFLNATGDDGALNSSTYSAPSLDPYIIQVGGTHLETSGAAGPWASEISWAYSGGGSWITGIGSAGKYTIPSWQSTAGVITAASKASTVYRNVPDIAAEADFDNPTADNGSYLNGYGGTSFAAPRMAGYIALVNQFAAANGGQPAGFFNPTLYTGANSSNYAHYLHDITVGSNPSTAGTAVSYPAVTGFDDVTGWGSPNGEGLLYYLAALPDFSISVGSQNMTITRGATGNTGTETVTVAPYNGFTGTVAMTYSALPTGVTATTATNTPSAPGSVTFSADANTAIQGTYPMTITGTSTTAAGVITRTSTFTLNILKRTNGDFSLSASSPTIVDGATGASTITVVEGALSGPIQLIVSGVPTGVTATIATNAYDHPGTMSASVTGTDVLNLSVAQSVVAGAYPITVTGTSTGNIVHSTTFILNVVAPTSYLLNGGFETVSGSTASNWTLTSGVLTNGASGAHSGSYYAYLDGYGSVHTDSATQTSIAIPAGKTSATLAFFLNIGTNETTTTAKNDNLTVTITPVGGTATTLAAFSNLDATGTYVYHSYDVSAYIGQTVTVTFTGVENSSLATAFRLDDVSLFTNPN